MKILEASRSRKVLIGRRGEKASRCYEPGKRDRLLLGREREREGERDNHPETGLPRKARNTLKPAGSKALVQKLSTQPHPPRRPPHNRGEDAKLVVVMPGGPSRETGANGGTGATIESENQSHMAPA
jgi:hypothetical protein